MKKSIGIMTGIILSFLSISSQAQNEIPKPVQQQPVVQQGQPVKTDTMTPQPVQNDRWNPKKNLAVAEINEKYKDKYIVSKSALTTEQIFPVLGKYESSTNPDAASVTITLDAENTGLVWIEGLPQGKIKAMLRKSPSTYKIPAQKTEDGKDVAEGTAIFDKETNTLSIIIGKKYNMADPLSVFAPEPVAEEPVSTTVVKNKKNKTKIKEVAVAKPWIYTGTKIEKAMVAN